MKTENAAQSDIFALGKDYFEKEQYDKAYPYLLEKAKAGHAPAQIMLAYMYESGLGVAADKQSAGYWYSLSAPKGNTSAEFILAQMYHKGIGVPKDLSKAFYWYTECAKTGDLIALEAFCFLAFDGPALAQYNVLEDNILNLAADKFLPLADEGSADAQYYLGCIYNYKKEYQTALLWFRESYKNGNTRTEVNIKRIEEILK